jgi:hypothetical protein
MKLRQLILTKASKLRNKTYSKIRDPRIPVASLHLSIVAFASMPGHTKHTTERYKGVPESETLPDFYYAKKKKNRSHYMPQPHP